MTQLHLGDCREVLRKLPANSIDSIVTDPPYGLEFMGNQWDAPWKYGVQDRTADGRPALPSFKSTRNPICTKCHHHRRGSRKCTCAEPAWDETEHRISDQRAFQEWVEEWGRECIRVAKPGAFILAFGGTRMWHRMAAGLEDAGWEIRDCMLWLYGQGFPKALDVSKAIQKARVEDEPAVRAVCRQVRAAMDERGLNSKDLVAEFGGCNPRLIDHWAARDTDSQPECVPAEHWGRLREVLGLQDAELDAEVARLNGRKGEHGDAWTGAEVVGEYVKGPAGLVGHLFTARDRLIREASPEAARWRGWFSCLKPAWEPIVLGMKPLEGTFAANALRWGVSGLHIDACRVERAPDDREQKGWWKSGSPESENVRMSGKNYARPPRAPDAGRWPANVILDEVAAGQLDAATGHLKGGTAVQRNRDGSNREAGAVLEGLRHRPAADVGYGASRFFYCAKPTRAERGEGNVHPTVKPIALMRYLCRLSGTPYGGTVLDPFLGSGTTGLAALREGRNFIGIELNPEYLTIARRRMIDLINLMRQVDHKVDHGGSAQGGESSDEKKSS